MATLGDTVFQAGEKDVNVEDMWDDTALIKAYDKAINSVLTQINKDKEVTEDETEGNNSTLEPPKTLEKKGKTKKKKKKANKHKWKLGDECRAVFTEDNVIYDGVIKTINYKEGTCSILYTEYGNKEDKYLYELLSLHPEPSKEDMYMTENGYEAVDKDTWSRPEQTRFLPETDSRYSPHRRSSRDYPPSERDPPMRPLHPSMEPHPSMESHPSIRTRRSMESERAPRGRSPQYSTPGPHPFDHGVRVPLYSAGRETRPWMFPQPPDTPSIDDSASQEDLHAMLMAWYMSGYHTGYYQGAKNAKRSAVSSLSER